VRIVTPLITTFALLLGGCPTFGGVFDFDGDGVDDDDDCRPEDPMIFPGANDIWGDGIDSNCDGLDGVDSDGDGFPGNAGQGEVMQDCHDGDPAIHPGAEEVPCDDEDNDCDEATPDGVDGDGDGVRGCDGDCDDEDDAVHPGADEGCDGVDTDCDGALADDELDLDGDGWTPCQGDCDDAGEDLGCGLYDGGELADALVVFEGEATGDSVGMRVAAAGDVDGDGFGDLLISGNHADVDTEEQGAIYVVMGPVPLGTFELADAHTRLIGEAENDIAGGETLAGGGDVDGDGIVDIAIGVSRQDPDGLTSAGAVYVVTGPPTAGTHDLGSSRVKIEGDSAGDQVGRAVALDGDVDGDGTDDLLIGAHQAANAGPGMACVVLGPVVAGITNLTTAADTCLSGENASDVAGASIAYAGQANDAPGDEFLVGAFNWDSQSGTVYLISWPHADLELGSAHTLFRGADDERAGYAVASAGDLDGNGYDDILISAHDAVSEQGRAYVQLSPAPLGEVDLASTSIVFQGAEDHDEAGRSIDAADLDGDGLPDLLIGAPGRFSERGAVFVLHAPIAPGSYSVEAEADALFTGEAAGDLAGWGMAGAGDVDGDGYDDLLVGAYGHADEMGRAYLVYAGLL
jgi:hypothetical protein